MVYYLGLILSIILTVLGVVLLFCSAVLWLNNTYKTEAFLSAMTGIVMAIIGIGIRFI